MRFLVDENLPVDIGLFLESASHDVLIVRRSPLVGSSDRVLWARAVKDDRIIVTRNHDFPLVGVVGKPSSGGPPELTSARECTGRSPPPSGPESQPPAMF